MTALKNQRHDKFCVFYTGEANGCGAKAYKMAGYTASNYKTATACARKLLKRSDVAERIAELRKSSESKICLDRDDCLKILSDIAANADRDSDRLKAIEILAKCQGYNEPEKTVVANIAPPLNLANLSEAEILKWLRIAQENGIEISSMSGVLVIE